MNRSFMKYLPKIRTSMQIEGSMRLIKQGLSIWWNKEKATVARDIRNRTLEGLSVWGNREKATKAGDTMNQILCEYK